MRATIVIAALLLLGCTDSTKARLRAYGEKARVTCYSGGAVIYDGCSTGKVASSYQSDGWAFMDGATGRLIDVSGACLVDYSAPCPMRMSPSGVPLGEYLKTREEVMP